jgi:hypothetical protein
MSLDVKGKKGVFLCLFLAAFFSFYASFSSGEVTTVLNISGAGPYLLRAIPNQSWPANENNTNAFVLDDYFGDDSGAGLNYTFDEVENVTIVIDSNHYVSFYPDYGFMGFRTVRFNASDGSLSAVSNDVLLNIGNDTKAPQWSNPGRSKATVYQNDYVNFSTTWIDDFWLGSFIFSINQDGRWVNYTRTNFTGLQNVSIYRVQISASAGSIVLWRFYAYDSTKNANLTEIQSFTVATPPSPPTPPGEEGVAYGGGVKEVFIPTRLVNFSVEPAFFKIPLKQGETRTKILRVSNIGNTNLSFNLSVISVEKFVLLSTYKFDLPVGQAKDITVDFSAKEGTQPEQYLGKIVVESGEFKEVPVIIDVNQFEAKFGVDVNILESYKLVRPGSKVVANITVRNNKDIRLSFAKLYISIKDFEGNLYDSSEEEINFTSVASFERGLTIPKSASYGNYLFYVRVSNEKDTAIGSDVFEVGTRFRFAAMLRENFLFLLIILLALLVAILMVKYRHDKEKERVLNLYLMLNEMRNFINKKKIDKALEIYIKIKTLYKEPLPQDILENKSLLMKEIEKLASKLDKSVLEETKKIQTEKKEEKKEETPAENKEMKKEGPQTEKKEEPRESKEIQTQNQQQTQPQQAPQPQEQKTEENKTPS